FAYPIGGEHGASAGTFVCFAMAAVWLWRYGRRTVAALCLAPFALGLVAAALERYPYGGSARTMQYVAPAICLFAGVGVALALGWLRRPAMLRWGTAGCLLWLALLGAGLW